MGKIVLNENEVVSMVTEMVRSCVGILTEAISSSDAYERFYKDLATPKQWSEFMKGAPSMTPLHKLAIDIMNGKWNNGFARKVGLTWNKLDQEGRKYVLDLISGEMARGARWIKSKTMSELVDILDDAAAAPFHTEAKFCDNGFLKLYEDDRIYITCTLSYSASKKHYGDTHWCTASDIAGRYNGYEMFCSYTTDSNAALLQFVPKDNRKGAIQAQFYSEPKGYFSMGSICNFFDKDVDENDLYNLFGGCRKAYKILVSFDYSQLANETKKLVSYEHRYWESRAASFEHKMSNVVGKSVMDGKYDDALVEAIRKSRDSWGDCFYPFEHEADDDELKSIFNIIGKTRVGLYVYNVFVSGSDKNEQNFIHRIYEDSTEKYYSVVSYVFIIEKNRRGTHVVGRFPGYTSRNCIVDNIVVLSKENVGVLVDYRDIILTTDGTYIAKDAVGVSANNQNRVAYKQNYTEPFWNLVDSLDGKYIGKVDKIPDEYNKVTYKPW